MKCSGMHMDDVHCIYTQCSAGLESAFSCIPACLRLICLWPNSAFEVSLLGLSGVLSGHALPTPLVSIYDCIRNSSIHMFIHTIQFLVNLQSSVKEVDFYDSPQICVLICALQCITYWASLFI